MNTTQSTPAKTFEIIIKLDKNGKRRATRLSYSQFRMLPMPLADADLAIATGLAVRATVHPLTGEPV